MLYFILNYKSIFDTVNFFQNLGFHNNSFVIGPITTPESLNVLNLPKDQLTKEREKLQLVINNRPGFLLQNSWENLLSYLTDTQFHANIETTKRTLKIMDLRRNIDSEKVFPKLYQEVLN